MHTFKNGKKFSMRKETVVMKLKSVKTSVFLMLAVLLLLFGFSKTFAAERPKFIKIAASSMGGTWFPLCAATAEVLNNNVKGTIFTATLGAGISNLRNIEAGTLYMGLGTGTSTYLASEGLKPFTKKTKKLRLIGTYYTYPYNLVVRADSNIYSIKDLEGKKVGTQTVGMAGEDFFRNLLSIYGMSYETIKAKGGYVTFAGWGGMNSMFRDRKLDFIIDPNCPPSPGIMEITALTPIRLLDVGPEAIEKLRKINPGYSTVEIPGGLYRGQDKSVVCVGDPTGMIISSDIADDLAYEITKAIFENTAAIGKVHIVLKEFSIKNALRGAYLPLHPGAYKYYQEKGITVPEHLRP
jgi:TRAP transporter TAXI family solute receptor